MHNEPLSTRNEFALARWLITGLADSFRIGLLLDKPTRWLEGWNFRPALWPMGMGKRQEIVFSHMTNGLLNRTYRIKAGFFLKRQKTKTRSLRELPSYEYIDVLRGQHTQTPWGEGIEAEWAPSHSPRLCPMNLIWMLLCVLYKKMVIVKPSTFLSSVGRSSEFLNSQSLAANIRSKGSFAELGTPSWCWITGHPVAETEVPGRRELRLNGSYWCYPHGFS